MTKFRALFVLLLVSVVLAAGCGSTSTASSQRQNFVDTASVITGVPTDKVLVIVAENHALSQFKTDAPFTYALGTQYGMATNMQAITHPSKPNYADMIFGENHGITSDSSKTVNYLTVFDNAIAAGRSAKTMAEGMGSTRCRASNTGKYVGRHNPHTFSSNKTAKANCAKYNFSYDTYGASDIANGKLANLEFLIPNQCNNAHDCSLATFDKWVKAQWTKITSGPDWTSGRLTVIITADEDDKKHGNVIPLFVANPNLHGKVVTSKLTLYSINRLFSQYGHTAYMGNGKTAPDLASAFGLTVQ